LLNDIAIANDKPTKDVTLGLFIDLSKAFNTMSHHILLSKMYKLGIRGIANDWFRSYLSERQQYVQIGKEKSIVRSIKCGVPQGSILGPILFIIYINDLHTATNLNVLTFADDTTIYSSGNNANDLITHVNTEFHKIFEWCCANKLSLNIAKTHYSIFSPTNISVNNTISLNDMHIRRINNSSETKAVKFLGVLIDENLTWKPHINYIKSKISRAIFAINKVKNILPRSALKSLYYSMVHCHLMYSQKT
jgi:hypothetical protein